MCAKILVYMMYIGKFAKAYIRVHNFYLVIFQAIFRFYLDKRLLIGQNQNWRFIKIQSITFKIYFKKYTVWREFKASFLVTFNINISRIFPESCILILHISLKIWIFISSNLAIFIYCLAFLLCYKKLKMSASIR